jgi:hypothetical protein
MLFTCFNQNLDKKCLNKWFDKARINCGQLYQKLCNLS